MNRGNPEDLVCFPLYITMDFHQVNATIINHINFYTMKFDTHMDNFLIDSSISLVTAYPWQSESNIHLPGGATSVAHQFLRCVLYQMAPNGIFMQIFQINLKGSYYCTSLSGILT